ncbi:MAG: hypothetical protein U0Z26_14095 [Anaerolineales bacterium]
MGIGWIVGLLLTIFVSTRVIWFLTSSASRSVQTDVLTGIAVAGGLTRFPWVVYFMC